MSEEPAVFRCHVIAENTEALREFVRETQPDVGCRPVVRDSRAGVGLDLYFRQDQLDRVRAARSAPSVDITAVENVTENWRARKEEVGGGDRFADRDAVPHGVGRKE
ncbi:hypothetical protein OG985_06150 [Streptomyces sp. NBC_00289]|uniref:hypothetical protein n=1 Tax=Streptomyces sp. NBC_00289 TaxID=2975703 RepID=UPI00324E33BE